MSLTRTLRLALVAGVEPQTLPLQPHEYFVLTRVEGRPTVGELIGVSGLGAEQTERVLVRLLELGALQLVDVPAPSRPRQSTQELRAQAQDRRLRTLQRQLGAGRPPSPTPSPAAPRPPPPPAAVEPESLHFEIPRVPADDARLDPTLGLALDEQRYLLAFDDLRRDLSPFERLGLQPTDDLKLIRAAFRDASRRLHPDAHHGKDLGRFRPLLASLFASAKEAHQQLQRADVRAPYLEVAKAAQEQRQRLIEQRENARRAAEELRARREQEQAAQRRAERSAIRAQRERERTAAAAQAKVDEYVQAAMKAEADDNFARAANHYRLALQLAPDDTPLRQRWEAARTTARRRRAKEAFARARHFAEIGHKPEAVASYLEAADADPTVTHLAHAADAVRDQDPEQARDLAMAALGSLTENERSEAPLRPAVAAELRLMIARAFLAAGLGESAREQALLVQRVRPKDPEARALLKSIKVT